MTKEEKIIADYLSGVKPVFGGDKIICVSCARKGILKKITVNKTELCKECRTMKCPACGITFIQKDMDQSFCSPCRTRNREIGSGVAYIY